MKEIFIDKGVFAIITAENEFLLDIDMASSLLKITEEQYKKYIYPLVDDKSTSSSAENYGHFLTKYREAMDFLTIKLPKTELYIDTGIFKIITGEYEGIVSKDRACCMLDLSMKEYDEYITKRLDSDEIENEEDTLSSYANWLKQYEDYRDFLTIKIHE